MKNSLELKILKENKQSINEIAPLVWGAIVVGGALASYLGYNAATKSHEDQEMIKNDKGFFVDEMWVGENFKITYFTGSEEPYQLMSFPPNVKGWEVFGDDYGAYIKIKGSSPNAENDLRVYLPKKEWFNQFKGKIKTITDYKAGSEESNTYSLCFYLKNPQKAIKTKVLRPDGSTFFGPPDEALNISKTESIDDPSRGWAVLETYKQSGYFSMKGDVFSDLAESKTLPNNLVTESNIFEETGSVSYYSAFPEKYQEKKDKEARESYSNSLKQKLTDLSANPPSGLQEYQWNTYGQKYAGSEFDNWYDSSSGTFVVIGMQICASIAFAPLAEYFALRATSAAAYAAWNIGVQVAGELIFSVWEAIYLYNRGLTSQAALIMFCCLLPVFSESMMFGKIIGRPPGFDDAIKDLAYKFGSGSFSSPADFKRWFKALDPALQKELQMSMTLASQYYSKASTKSIAKQLGEAMAKAIDDIEKTGIKGEVDLMKNWDIGLSGVDLLQKNPTIKKYLVAKSSLKNLKNLAFAVGGFSKGKNLLLKGLGLNLLMVGGVLFPICTFAIKDNEEFIKDPQGILNGAEMGIASFQNQSSLNAKKFEEQVTAFVKKMNDEKDVDKALQYAKEYIQILVELNFISKTNSWGDKKKQYHKLIENYKKVVLAENQALYYQGLQENNLDKTEKSLKVLENISVDTKNKTVLAIINGTPSSYKQVQSGYIDSEGVKHVPNNDELIKFFEWFSGYNIGSKQITNTNPYQVSNGATFTAQFTFQKPDGTPMEKSRNFNNKLLINMCESSFNNQTPGLNLNVNFSDPASSNYWGNIYFVRKIFSDYYDDYLLSKKK